MHHLDTSSCNNLSEIPNTRSGSVWADEWMTHARWRRRRAQRITGGFVGAKAKESSWRLELGFRFSAALTEPNAPLKPLGSIPPFPHIAAAATRAREKQQIRNGDGERGVPLLLRPRPWPAPTPTGAS